MEWMMMKRERISEDCYIYAWEFPKEGHDLGLMSGAPQMKIIQRDTLTPGYKNQEHREQ
jgi:hypothetical protein